MINYRFTIFLKFLVSFFLLLISIYFFPKVLEIFVPGRFTLKLSILLFIFSTLVFLLFVFNLKLKISSKNSSNYVIFVLSLTLTLLITNILATKYFKNLTKNLILDSPAFSSSEKKILKEEFFSKECTKEPVYKTLYFFNSSLSNNCKNFSSTKYDRDLVLRSTTPYSYNHLNEFKNLNEIPEIWFFGGSTIYSIYVTDKNTIPSVVAKNLKKNKISNKIINFGMSGLNIQYELSNLISVLKTYSNKPKIIIFYDGYNDSLTSMVYGGDHINIAFKIGGAQLFSKKEQLFYYLSEIFSDYSYIYYRFWSHLKYNYYAKKINLKQFTPEEAALNYLNTVELVSIILDNLNIEKYFILQPMVFSKNVLTKNEKSYLSEENIIAGRKVYNLIKEKLKNNESFVDLSKIFNNKNYGELFYDEGHLGDIGNIIIGNSISKIISKNLK